MNFIQLKRRGDLEKKNTIIVVITAHVSYVLGQYFDIHADVDFSPSVLL